MERETQRIRPIKRACADCHARKVKCDGGVKGFPCTNCKSASIECLVPERRKRRCISTHDAGTASARRVRRSSRQTEADDVTATSPISSPRLDAATNGQAQQTTSQDGGEEQELAKRHLVDFFSQDLQDKPIGARLTYVGNELSNLNYLTRQRAADQHIYHYPTSNPYVPRVFRGSRNPAAPSLIPRDAFVLPPKRVSDNLVKSYFDLVHPAFPIIDRLRFLSLYHDPDSTPSLLLLQAICLAGSHVAEGVENGQDLKMAFFRRAKALIDGRYEEDRMEMVQAALLLAWFSDGGDDVCANAWWWIGVAARAAMGLGMHREVGPSNMPPENKRTWRMIWWGLVQFDCLVSLASGRPQAINLDDCDTPPLTLDDFDPDTPKKAAYFVMHHSSLCALISDLVRTHFSVKARKSHNNRREVLYTIDLALAQWLINLPPELREQGSTSEREPGPWSQMILLTYNAVLIQFHRPMAKLGRDESTLASSSDEEICAEAASAIIHLFERLQQQSALKYCWFSAPSTLFTALLQISGQLKCDNPIRALRAQEMYDSGLRSLRKLARHWLFAASLWRLFQSNLIKPTQTAPGQGGIVPAELDPGSAGQQSLEGTSSSLDPPRDGLLNHDISREMNWVQPPAPGDEPQENMQVQRNRWINSLDEWNSLYWSDPLAHVQLQDDIGDLQFNWIP